MWLETQAAFCVTAVFARGSGYNLYELKAAGYVEGLKAAGFTCAEVKEAGFLTSEVARAGYGADEAKAAGFFKIAAGDVTVFHDELELPPGKVRVKIGGGIAGHNGLRSISAHIGNDYRRVRLGIGHPGVKELVHGHVLSDFAKADNDWVTTLCEAVAEHAGLVAKGTDATFANRVHLAMQAKGFLTKDDNGKE